MIDSDNKKNQISWQKGLQIVLIVLLSLLLTCNVITAVLSRLGLRRTYRWFPGAFVAVESGSMEPVLHTGDLIFVWGTSYKDVKVGDIVTVYTGEEFLTHGVTRIEDRTVITKGLQNEEEDVPAGEAEYVARMLFCIRGGAALWEWLCSPLSLVLLSGFLFLLCFAGPLCRLTARLISRRKRKEENGRSVWGKAVVLRAVAFICLLSVVLTAPLFSSAKFQANINDQVELTAKSVYFTSNYLTSEGYTANVWGWGGLSHEVHLVINNFDNDLLYNASGTDLEYKMEVNVKSVSVSGTNLSLEEIKNVLGVSVSQNAVELPAEDGVYSPDIIPGGSPQKSEIFVRLYSKLTADDHDTTVKLAAGTHVEYEIVAYTTGSLFEQTISATYILEVMDDTSFISGIEVHQNGGSALFDVTMFSNQVPGIPYRIIRYRWDPNVVYLNEYDATAMYLKRVGTFNKDQGYLEIKVQPLSTIALQFFKRKSGLNVTVNARYVAGHLGDSHDEIIISATDLH